VQTHAATLTIYSWNKDWSDCQISHQHFEFESSDKRAKNNLLKEVRRRLKNIKNSRRKIFSIVCCPRFKTKRALDGTKMLRNRSIFDTKSSIMRVGAERLFVEGYGPKAQKELER
jgi:hypothetical protein